LTQKSFKKLDNIYNSSMLSTATKKYHSRDITLAKMIQNRNFNQKYFNFF